MTTGALILRGVGLTFEVEEGGTESRRSLTLLVGTVGGVGLTVGGFRQLRDGFLLDGFVQELPMSGSPFKVAGRANMEALCSGDGSGFSSITSDFANWRHSESISKANVERETGRVSGMRRNSTEGISVDGRCGGGYVVGNAWGGADAEERGLDS